MATILVIDDDFAIADVIQTILEENNYTVITATNGREGLEMIKQHKPDLVLCDERMPYMRGIDVCAELYNDPSLRNIPVVLISAHVGESIATSPNCIIFLRKPFNYNDLLIVVEDSLFAASN